MPSRIKPDTDTGGVGSQPYASGSHVTLHSLQRRFEKNGHLGDTSEQRRAAWLFLLAVPYQPVAAFAKGNLTSSDLLDPASASEQSTGGSSVRDTPSLSSDSKDTSLESIATPSRSVSISGSLPASPSDRSVPLDREGWQTGFESALLLTESHMHKGTKPSTEVWQVAESKRTRRRKTTQDTCSGHHVGPDDNGIFGSVVDLGEERSDRLRVHNSYSNGSSSRRGSSAASTAGSRVMLRPSPHSAPPSGSVSFAALPIDVDESSASKQADKRNKRKKAKAGSTNQDRQCSGSAGVDANVNATGREDEATGPTYKLAARFSEQFSAHRDERQVELDILRSFVGPVSEAGGGLASSSARQLRRQQLQDLVVGVLRRHRNLNYYQGYHDVLSALLLVLSPHHPVVWSDQNGAWASEEDFKLVLEACERFSLFYIRDFMTLEITPCMGWLKVLRNLLRQVDPGFAKTVIEQTSALPFFALSWLITLLSHDLELGGPALNKVFDSVLVSGPETILWIIAALLLESREDLLIGDDLQSDDGTSDPALLHHALSGLPQRVSKGRFSVDEIIANATRLRRETGGGVSHIREGVMGSHSVLQTWSPLSAGPARAAAASRGAVDWKLLKVRAEECVSSSDSLQKIVLDPNPTPPAEDESAFEFEQDSNEKIGRGKKRATGDRRVGKNGSGTAVTSAALLVGVVVVAGAAMLLGGQTIDRHQKSKLAHDLSDLGKGLVGLALCAAGACQ